MAAAEELEVVSGFAFDARHLGKKGVVAITDPPGPGYRCVFMDIDFDGTGTATSTMQIDACGKNPGRNIKIHYGNRHCTLNQAREAIMRASRDGVLHTLAGFAATWRQPRQPQRHEHVRGWDKTWDPAIELHEAHGDMQQFYDAFHRLL